MGLNSKLKNYHFVILNGIKNLAPFVCAYRVLTIIRNDRL